MHVSIVVASVAITIAAIAEIVPVAETATIVIAAIAEIVAVAEIAAVAVDIMYTK